MKRTLYHKLVFIYILFGIAGFVLISTLGSRLVEDNLVTAASTSLYNEASKIASRQASLYYSETRTYSDLYDNLSSLASYQDSQIWLISPDGEILLNTAQSPTSRETVFLDQFDPVALGSQYYSTGNFFDYFNTKMLSVMVPVTSNLRIKGYVAIHISLQDIYDQREELIVYIDLLFFLIYGLSLFILLFFSLGVYHPLQKIISGVKEYAAGNLNYNIPVKTNDELGYLASTLNYMSDELNKTGEYQKKFVANVSHDFRSPLTSIKGYVEAILDGTIPLELQEKYLNIVLFETERLNKLTQSLLTLNDIDRKGHMLDITVFDINAVIKDTAATFEGICTSKRISISLVFLARSLYVSADMGKIQQVLYNLIDNAIKFSDNDSTITVETTEKHGKVLVSVKDTGCGIPKESITKIWERFYKLDASRGKDRKGTGLGLSIVKEIINAHHQNINVISTPGVGTEFIFTLDRASEPPKNTTSENAAKRG
ncbi:MAG: HAMP domain-containing sensor histidine kinase [Fusicatenibacter sp.]|nr:HAMP domain-containing sensor histidine kinase [Lachnospiraceae bacterium]MDY2938804.1 HAMP domain-containing sensor histidine kinase [Fusicatenibacter sp.]